MAMLPVEVVANIFRYLTVSDRKEASLVSHVWYEASLDPILLRDTIISFPAQAISSSIIKSLARRRAPNLVLENLDSSFRSQMLFQKSSDYVSNYLVSLSLKGSNISESAFIEIMTNCGSLEVLDLRCCNSLFMSGMLLSKAHDVERLQKTLTKITEVNLSSNRHISDVLFNRIINVCQDVQKLDLAGNQIIFHTDHHYNNGRSSKNTGSTVTLTFNNLLATLEKTTKLTCLNLSRTSIDETSLERISCVPGLVLEELHLVNCRELGEKGVINFCKHQKSLQILDLGQCMMCGDAVLTAICSTQPDMKKLALSKLRISDGSVSQLHQLMKLKTLDLSSCDFITHKGLITAFTKSPASNIRNLNLSCCGSIKDRFILGVAQQLDGVTRLDLGSTGITDWGLVLVSKFATHLEYLRLAWCRHITDDGLLGFITLKYHEEHDGECQCTKEYESRIFRKPTQYREPSKHTVELADLINSATNGEKIPLSNLTRLRGLDLTACRNITDESLMFVLPAFQQLQNLKLSLCTKLTDQTLHTIAHNNLILQSLDISSCLNFSDDGMSSLVQRLPRLTDLNVSDCDKLSDVSIDAMRRYSKRLKHLDVSLNSQISGQAIDKLEQSLPHLVDLQKRLIGDIEDGAKAF